MQRLLASNDPKSAIQVYNTINKPSPKLFGYLLSHLMRSPDTVPYGLQLYQQLPDRLLHLDSATYQSLISGYLNTSNNLTAALQVYHHMRFTGLNTLDSRAICESLLRACLDADNTRTALTIYTNHLVNFADSNNLCNLQVDLIQACCRMNSVKQCTPILTQWTSSRCLLNTQQRHTIMKSLLDADDYTSFKLVYHAALSSGSIRRWQIMDRGTWIKYLVKRKELD